MRITHSSIRLIKKQMREPESKIRLIFMFLRIFYKNMRMF